MDKYNNINDFLKEVEYNSNDGNFYWKNPKQGRPQGRPAGSKNGRGYNQIKYNGTVYSVPRLIWYLHTGELPDHDIGYVDGDTTNTRWDNLKEITSSDRTERYRESVKDTQQKYHVGQLVKPVRRARFSNAQVTQAVEDFIKDKKLVNGRYV